MNDRCRREEGREEVRVGRSLVRESVRCEEGRVSVVTTCPRVESVSLASSTATMIGGVASPDIWKEREAVGTARDHCWASFEPESHCAL